MPKICIKQELRIYEYSGSRHPFEENLVTGKIVARAKRFWDEVLEGCDFDFLLNYMASLVRGVRGGQQGVEVR